jgi:hypothetical protein
MLTRIGLAAVLALGASGMGLAQGEPVETADLGTSRITLHVHDFLSGDELTTLRLVMVNADALALFVPEGGGYAALAMAPDEGFISEGAVVKSAVALAGLPDAATAEAEAVASCDALRVSVAPCVLVLEIAPKD